MCSSFKERSGIPVRGRRYDQNYCIYALLHLLQEETLVNLRFFVPQGDNEDDENTAAYLLQQMVLERAGLSNNSGNMITELDERVGSFVTPRGRYTMEFYDNYMRMNGETYTYKILY